jgi:SHO1 osmosensor
MLSSHPEGFPALLGDYTMHAEGGANTDANVPLQSINSPTLTTATKTGSAGGNKNKTSRPTTPLNATGTGGLPLATPQAPLLARALYTYKANPDDPNELSFDKGEMLEIIDNRGKWWQVKRRDGNGVAIAPSNYLQLVT